jgi:asparagine N-glycosylation enzyme membrane subunit Stt3
MQYNKTDVELVKRYKSKNMSNKTIIALLYKQSKTKYTENDIRMMMMEAKKESKKPSDNGRLFDVASGIVMNPEKRKKAKHIFFAIIATIVIGLILLGLFVSWTPVIIITSCIVGLVFLLVLTFFILFKSGILEKIMDKYGF